MSVTLSELDKAEHDLFKAEKLQNLMKDANSVIRSNKDVTNRLVNLGMPEAQAIKIQQPDFAGRIGFAQYQLTNNNASIKRLQARVKMLKGKVEGAKAVEKGGAETYSFTMDEGGTIEINYPEDRVQIRFSVGRVPGDVYKKMRANGYVFSPTNKAFQRKITPQAISNAVRLMGAVRDVQEAEKEEETEFIAPDPVENKIASEEGLKGVTDQFQAIFTPNYPELPPTHPLNILDPESNQYKEALAEYRNPKPTVATETTTLPNTPEEFDAVIMENIDAPDDWIGNLIKERTVKQQIYKQLNGEEEAKKQETERLFQLYAEKEKRPYDQLHEQHRPVTVDYDNMLLDDLIALKKSKYSNPDIESAMSDDEKALTKAIADKFSVIQEGIRERRKAKEEQAIDTSSFIDEEVLFESTSKGGKEHFLMTFSAPNGYSYKSNGSGGSGPISNVEAMKRTIKNELEYAPVILIDKLNLSELGVKTEQDKNKFLSDKKEDRTYSDKKELNEAFKLNSEEDAATLLAYEDVLKDILKLFESGVVSAKSYFQNAGVFDLSKRVSEAKTFKKARLLFNEFISSGKSTMEQYLLQADGYAVGLIGNDLYSKLKNKYVKSDIGSPIVVEPIGKLSRPVSSSDSQIQYRYPKLSKSEVNSIYNQVESILSKDTFTPEDKYILEKYEGLGSQTQTGVIDKGLLHQFYTPYIVAKKMYDLANHYGFKGGNILEPSMGTGRFFKYAPTGSTLFGFDPDKKNIEIAKILYPGATTYQDAFETAFLEQPRLNKMAKKSWLPEMDLCIGNPPYGDYVGYYKSFMPSVFKRFEFLFVYLGLKTLKKDGLLIFIVSQNFMNNGAMYNGMKAKILEIGTFVDAIRMPNGIFSSTDVGTDLVIFKRK